MFPETCYLDYGGTTPYARSMVDKAAADLKASLYGNPHSNSSSSVRATQMVEHVRRRVLHFFRADPGHFDVIFVANATAAIKLVGYCFQDYASTRGFWYGYHSDAHTSLVGLRELARSGYHCFRSDDEVEKWLNGTMMDLTEGEKPAAVEPPYRRREQNETVRLLAYPAQSNMNGRRLPKDWPLRVRQLVQRTGRKIFTLLDAAAFVSTAQLDLSNVEMEPDFTALSFYKIFGMPDLGALIVRKESSEVLRSRRYFGGGTVDTVIAYGGWHARKTENLHDILEDGTVPFHSLVMLDSAISVHESLFSSMATISKHVTLLSQELYTGLSQLRHANGRSVCHIYKGLGSTYGDSTTQGPTVAFNVRRGNGAWIPVEHFEALANACNIQIRTGGVCNPGGIAEHLQLQPWEMRRNFFEGFRCGQPFKIRGGKPTGIIRASLGAMSNRADIQTFVSFVQKFFVEADSHGHHACSTAFPNAHDLWTVQRLQIYPIRQGPAWQLPPNQDWEVEDKRLTFDGEWGVVDLEEGKVIRDSTLTRLLPELHPEAGTLRISDNSKAGTTALEISLWDSPTGDWLIDSLEMTRSTRRIARRYASEDISTFLSSTLGRPCTLARYSEFGVSEVLPVALKEDYSSKQDIADDGITVEFCFWKGEKPSATDSSANILLLSSSQGTTLTKCPPDCLQIGSQKFTSIVASERSEEETSSSAEHPRVVRFRRLPDCEESLASQNTVIRVGDAAEAFHQLCPPSSSSLSKCPSEWEVEEEEDFTSYQFCPVAGCTEKRPCYESLVEHLKVHAEEFLALRRRRRMWKQRVFSCCR
ncbi:hypothetical protein VTN77DRAFT_9901 [Rasamsonia byssochlamydoides]|uniref:uncharacterized protein n=1 Tax=Rasamsonia byssochlamydoides TaxID=89139 RepID=UPI0037444948